MNNRRTILIGDVHGCIDELKKLFDKLVVRSEDRIIFLGDLMDRGPDPVAVLRFVRERGYECVQGNHEEKHIRWRRHEWRRKVSGKANPMHAFPPERLAQHEALTDDEMEWMTKLPLLIRFKHDKDNWIACHAGLPFNQSPDTCDPRMLVRIRYLNKSGVMVRVDPGQEPPEGAHYWTDLWKGPESVVYGHIVQDSGPRIDLCRKMPSEARFPGTTDQDTWAIGIDTGCCFGGKLTAAIFTSIAAVPMMISEPAAQVYYARHREGVDE
jgi:hypothetical protein